MDKSQQQIENLVEYISQTVSLNRRLQKKKVDTSMAKLAFTQLDKKRKGYLDLGDVYQLCGQVTQDQLFVVFKWLDWSKTGDITYQDFQLAITSGQANNKNEESSAVQLAKNVITTFLQNWDYSKGLREKLKVNEQSLSNVYKWICQSQRKATINTEDLIDVFKNSKKWDSLCKQEVKNLFRSVRNITQKVFCQSYLSINQSNAYNNISEENNNTTSKNNTTAQYNEQQLLDDINKQYHAKRQVPRFNSQNVQEVNKLIQQKYPKNLQRQNKYVSSIKQPQTPSVQQNYQSNKRQMDFKTQNIQSLLSNIQKRRQQLRKGSLQRKKLIDQALSRKKSNLPNFSSASNTVELYEPRTYSRPVSTPKSNSHSQVYVNNFVDVNKNDFGKIFNRYKDQRQNVINIQTRYKQRKSQLPYQDFQWTQSKTPKFINQTSTGFDYQNFRNTVTPHNETQNRFMKGYDNYVSQTPKFSQTAQQRFFERPSSSHKVDRYEKIRQKISNLPQRNSPSIQNQNKQIDRIIQKYRNLKPNTSEKVLSPKINMESIQYSQKVQDIRRPGYSSYLMNQSPSNMKRFDNLINYQSDQRKAPDSYIQQQKSRLNGSIYQYRSSNGSVQKQNLLRRAQEQAARKIQQIQRKAKLKVLQRKSAVGLKWVK